MAQETRVTSDGNGPAAETTSGPRITRMPAGGEASLGELFKELAQESSTLIRQEIRLARTEMQANLKSLSKDAALIAAGGGVLMLAMLVFTAFLVAAVGDLLGNEYWLGALIVGTIYALIGGVLVMRGRSGMKEDGLKPDQTIQSLQADKRWAQSEVQQVKRDLTT